MVQQEAFTRRFVRGTWPVQFPGVSDFPGIV
jgi:hypothetical protein